MGSAKFFVIIRPLHNYSSSVFNIRTKDRDDLVTIVMRRVSEPNGLLQCYKYDNADIHAYRWTLIDRASNPLCVSLCI